MCLLGTVKLPVFNENSANKTHSWWYSKPSPEFSLLIWDSLLQHVEVEGISKRVEPDPACTLSAAPDPTRQCVLSGARLLCISINRCIKDSVVKYSLCLYLVSEKQWALLVLKHFTSRGLYFLLYPKTCGCQLSWYYDPLASAGIVDYVAFWISWLPWIIRQKGCQHFDFNYNCYN